MEEDRHLNAAEIPKLKPDVLIGKIYVNASTKTIALPFDLASSSREHIWYESTWK